MKKKEGEEWKKVKKVKLIIWDGVTIWKWKFQFWKRLRLLKPSSRHLIMTVLSSACFPMSSTTFSV